MEELLISCVQARPPLWDSRLPIKDRSKTIRDNLWTEIFQEFGENPNFPLDFLIKKWRNLRDTYVRLKGEYTPSGSAAIKKKKWEYIDVMSFLNDTISYKTTVSNLDIRSPTDSRSSSITPPLPSPTTSKPPKKFENAKSAQKIEGALLDALTKINTVPVPDSTLSMSSIPMNPICIRISELLEKMPQQPRTELELKLLQLAYDQAKCYLT